ncbi:MAG: PAS domain S-box protein [Leptospiraceae bacterium]|nr:PAS domain S-box protein [Leptospiraceae bacterium]
MNLFFQAGGQSRLILTHDWKISYFNRNVASVFQELYNSPLQIGISIQDYIDIPLLSFFRESFQSALDGEEVFRKKIITLEEKEYWFQFSFYPLWENSSQVCQILFVSEDVTDAFQKEIKISKQEKERIRIEEYLKHSEEKWRSLVESSPNIIFTLDKNFNFTYINYPVAGLKLQDILGSNYLDFIQIQDQLNIKKYLTDCLQRGIVREFEIQGNVKDSLTAWYTVRIAPIRNNFTNEIEAIIGTASEITEKKVAERVLLESEERFRNMADNAPVMIWISGIDSKCNFFNKPWLDFTGRTMEEEIGTGWIQSVHPDDLNFCVSTYMESFQRKQSFEMEYRLKRYDGEFRWLLDRGVPFITSNGEFSGFIGSCIDITERKQFESEIKASLDEKEILLKEIHHRVKNNLQIISSLLSLQANQLEDPLVLEIFQANIRRVKSIALIHDMLNLSFSHSKINFKDYLKLICNYLLTVHETKPNIVTLNLISDDILISIDIAIYIGLIVNELVSNTLKYAFPEGRKGNIRIEIKWETEKKLSLIVSDDGIGIPTYFNLEEVKSLGIKLVNTLIKQMKGNIFMQNENGLVFTISIPLQEEKGRGK